MLFFVCFQMSLDKVNEGFEGDQKTLVKEKSVSIEEGQGGDEGGRQVSVHDDEDYANDGDDDGACLEEGQGGDEGGRQVLSKEVKLKTKFFENALGDYDGRI